MTLAERLTHYFYAWEARGRGWHLHDTPVSLEPPFEPFHPQSAIASNREDDGKHATYLHFLFRKMFPTRKKDVLELPSPDVRPVRQTPYVVFNISLPRSFDLGGYEAKQLLLMLSYSVHPVSFEVVGRFGRMDIQIACSESDAEHVQSQVKACYPTCTVLKSQDALASLADGVAHVLQFGLGQEFMRPLAFEDSRQTSMHLGFKGVFDTLKPGECACVQILFQGTRCDWTQSILRSVSDGHGHSFFEDAPEMPKLARQKTSSQLFGVAIRIAITAQTPSRADMLIRNLGHALVTQSASPHNALVPLPNEMSAIHEDIMKRVSRRGGMLLNTDELSTFAHIPDDAVVATALSHVSVATKALPAELKSLPHVLGINDYQGTAQRATVSDAHRFTHMHVIGATGTGKSTFLLGQIVQDIRNGNGVAVLDPHGDLIDSLLSCIPEHRLKDVIVVDPSDMEYSVGFNILKANTELEKEVLSSDLVSVFQKLSTSWGDQMNSVLANALLAFLDNSEQGTLVDVRTFLLEKNYRNEVLKTCTDPSVQYYWRTEFPLLRTNSIGSILTRLDAFLRPKAIRYMMGQKNGLNFDDILNSQRILLVKLSHGLIGESNSYLLGSLIVSKIYQTALARQGVNKEDRKGFFVYIDEFQHYVTPSLTHILSGGRKYAVGLVLAHQSLDQISKSDTELASSLIANSGIRVCFRLGENDAQKLGKGFASFNETDLCNLSTGQALCRVGRSDMDFNMQVSQSEDIRDAVTADSVIQSSRMTYAAPRAELAALIDSHTPQKEQEEKQERPNDIEKSEEVPVVPPIPKAEKEEISVVHPVVIEDPELVKTIVRRKEESKHKYLQMLIKRNAESRGYKATLEQPTKDGKGRVDIVLQKDKLAYAVEVGVTTTKEWEVHNIEKCLADGFSNIVALSEDMKGADLMTRKLTGTGILPAHADKVKVYDLTGFMGIINANPVAEKSKTKTIKGYRVKVEYGRK